MPETASSTAQPRSGQRAKVVCHRCHEKKIRCDLRLKSPCSACVAAEADCEFRPSHRGKRKRKPATIEAAETRVEEDVVPRQSRMDVSRDRRMQEEAGHVPEPNPSEIARTNFVRALLGHQAGLRAGNPTADTGKAVSGEVIPNEVIPSSSLQANLETFFDLCYCWCPIIDPATQQQKLDDAPVLQHGLALMADTIRPSLLPNSNVGAKRYERVRGLFHSERQGDALTLIRTAILLASSRIPPSSGGCATDSSFWWLGVAIRLGQDIRLHRQSTSTPSAINHAGMRKRIWWTLFARERVMALCQGRPCLINEDDCNLQMPQTEDFPASRLREAQIFCNWAMLCRIMADVNKHMLIARRTGNRIPTQEIAAQLTAWLRQLPAHLHLQIATEQTISYDRDVHLLHIPYLTTVSLVYLNTTGQDLPEISVAAVVAGACTARIFQDFLVRGSVRFLPEDAGWYIAVAIIALMHVRPLGSLSAHTKADIQVLRTALGHMGEVWQSSKILAAGLDKMVTSDRRSVEAIGDFEAGIAPSATNPVAAAVDSGVRRVEDLCAYDGVSWFDFFPFATVNTSPMLNAILTECSDTVPDMWPAMDLTQQFDEFWEDFALRAMDFSPDNI